MGVKYIFVHVPDSQKQYITFKMAEEFCKDYIGIN